MSNPSSAPSPTIDDLAELEDEVGRALAERRTDAIDVIGFGEISIALGWPAGAPTHACKRTPPMSRSQFEHYRGLIERYTTALAAIGVSSAETVAIPVDRGDRLVAYLVQPLEPAATLGDNVLREATPSADHPLLVELARLISATGPRLSVDAQITNWSWDGASLTLLDVGTPFLWDDQGRFALDMSPFLVMLPRPVRPLAAKDLLSLTDRWRTPGGVALDAIAGLNRLGLDTWIEPMLEAFNSALDLPEPLTAAEGRAYYDEDVATWPRLKRLQQLERAWQTKVRRRPYDFFIQNSFTDEII